MKKRILIMGAAGRDFHNFNVFFRNNTQYDVICFTATQIPGIAGRKYPRQLAGRLYNKGIPIYPEEQLVPLIKNKKIDVVVFSYSDVPHEEEMHKASIALAAGADFWLLGPESTMIKSRKKVISVCAVRTGSGKSQTTRKICELLEKEGKKVVVIRHPMPYGDLAKQSVQRFASLSDLDKNKCTIEEREEYEPHIRQGRVVYAGVDYEKILRNAEKDADIIVWDGGNNDFSFYKPDCEIVVADPLRAGHEMRYHPGETNFRRADIIIINKINSATKEQIQQVKKNISLTNSKASTLLSKSLIKTEENIKNKKVLVIEDGPTVTHGGMKTGAGTIAAQKNRCDIIDPTPYLIGSLKKTFEKYPHLKQSKILPAMGYSTLQVKELAATINQAHCDYVVSGTPIDLKKVFEKIKINKPIVQVSYYSELDDKKLLLLVIKKLGIKS